MTLKQPLFPMAQLRPDFIRAISCGLLLSAASCATIVTGSHDNVKIESDPAGAVFETNSGQRGTTPAVVTIADSEVLRVTVRQVGFADASAQLEPRMSGWVAGNLLLGGLIGLAIDFISGQFRTHDDRVFVKLVPGQSTLDPSREPVSPPAPSGGGTVVDASGTGVCVSPDGYIATAYHLVRTAKDISVRFADGTSARGRLENWDADADVAVLKVDRTSLTYLGGASREAVVAGARVFTVGFPAVQVLGREPKYSDGAVNSTTGIQGLDSYLQVSIPIQPGNSGGPVVTEQGEVAGIVVSTAAVLNFVKETGALPQNVNWASKFANVQKLFPAPPPLVPCQTHEQAVKRSMEAACFIQVREGG